MQAIVTKFIGPTNTRPARIKATCDAKTRVYSVEELPPGHDVAHDEAALRLAIELEWLDGYKLVGGGMPGNTGNCYVLVKV